MSFDQARHHRATGKDPPMGIDIPMDIRQLIYKTVSDPIKRIEFISALEKFGAYLLGSGRKTDWENFLNDERIALLQEFEEQQKVKSRDRLKIVHSYLAPALVAIIARIVEHNVPFG